MAIKTIEPKAALGRLGLIDPSGDLKGKGYISHPCCPAFRSARSLAGVLPHRGGSTTMVSKVPSGGEKAGLGVELLVPLFGTFCSMSLWT